MDHKAVLIDFNREKTIPKPYINRTILSDPRTYDFVLAAVADTYLAQLGARAEAAAADQEALRNPNVYHDQARPRDYINSQKAAVGSFLTKLKENNDIFERHVLDRENVLTVNELAA